MLKPSKWPSSKFQKHEKHSHIWQNQVKIPISSRQSSIDVSNQNFQIPGTSLTEREQNENV